MFLLDNKTAKSDQPLQWKEVLDSTKKHHGQIFDFVKNVVTPSGYTYFVWNDRVYRYISDTTFEATDWTINNIE